MCSEAFSLSRIGPRTEVPLWQGCHKHFVTQTKVIEVVGNRDEPFKKPIMYLVIPGLHRVSGTDPGNDLFRPIPRSGRKIDEARGSPTSGKLYNQSRASWSTKKVGS